MRWRSASFLALLFVLMGESSPAPAAEPTEIILWPNGAPLATGTEAKDIPILRLWKPDAAKSVKAAVVVCPGGGYRFLAEDHEGRQIAAWLVERGITPLVLRYRIAPNYKHPCPLMDVQRAIRWVRANADSLGIQKDRIGVWGFSAGGHLASTASTHFDEGDGSAADPVDKVSSRPDFAILCYPVISMSAPYAHAGCRDNLLGKDADPALAESLSNETQVTAKTPPTFLFHTDADPMVLAEHVIAYYTALRKARVPSELHIYEHGPHGVGLATSDAVLSSWPDRLADWLVARGVLPAK